MDIATRQEKEIINVILRDDFPSARFDKIAGILLDRIATRKFYILKMKEAKQLLFQAKKLLKNEKEAKENKQLIKSNIFQARVIVREHFISTKQESPAIHRILAFIDALENQFNKIFIYDTN